MSLKELLDAYLKSSEAVAEFSRRPDAVFDRFQVDEEIRKALAKGDTGALMQLIDAETLALLRKTGATRPPLHIFYPSPDLQITDVKSAPDPIRAREDVWLYVTVKWSYSIVPNDGLPAYVHIGLNPMSRRGVPFEVRTVPVFLDLDNPEMRLRQSFQFAEAGKYQIVVAVKMYDAVSTPVTVDVEP